MTALGGLPGAAAAALSPVPEGPYGAVERIVPAEDAPRILMVARTGFDGEDPGRQERHHLWAANDDGSNPVRLTGPAGTGDIIPIGITPDGARVAWAERAPEPKSPLLYYRGTTDGAVKELIGRGSSFPSASLETAGTPSLSDDGAIVALARARAGTQGRARTPSTSVRLVVAPWGSSTFRTTRRFSLLASTNEYPSADGRVNCLVLRSAGGLRLATVGPDPLRVVVGPPRRTRLGNTTICLTSNDGTTAVALTDRAGRAHLLRRTGGRNSEFALPRFSRNGASLVGLSPTGRHALISVRTDVPDTSGGADQLVEIVDLQTRRARIIRLPFDAVDSPTALSDDGRYAVYVIRTPSRSVLWVVRLSSGQITKIPLEAGHSGTGVAFTPDSSRIVLSSSSVTSQKTISVDVRGAAPVILIARTGTVTYVRTNDGSRAWALYAPPFSSGPAAFRVPFWTLATAEIGRLPVVP